MMSTYEKLKELEVKLLEFDKEIRLCEEKIDNLKKMRYELRVKLADEILKYEKETRDERRKERD